jgi:hypothetical protein
MSLTPQQLSAWTSAIAGLAGAGVQIGKSLKGAFSEAHQDLTPAEADAAWQAILQDDLVKASLAAQAAGPAAPAGAAKPNG